MAAKPKPEDQNLPATASGASVPAFLADKINEDAGKGVSNLADDNLVPLVYILQAQSPQCSKRSPDYVEGAETGAIWLRNSGLPAVPGDEGILFQPCYFQKDWVEWIPRSAGGGFAGRHDERPAEAKEQALDPQNPKKLSWVLPNGNTLSETRYHIGYVITPDGATFPYVIPMASSGHTVSRGWMFLMNSKQIGSHRAPSWAALYRLKTKERSNAAGTWSTWDITDAGWVKTAEEYARGAALHASFAAGEKQIQADHDMATEVGEDAVM